MRVHILGSGGWAGIPAAFCHCRVCTVAAKNPTGKDNRTRPQLLIENNQGKLLIEISPDIRLQSIRWNLPIIQHFFISHAHFDHMSGLLGLNSWIRYLLQEKPFIYSSEKTKEKLDTFYVQIPKEVVVLQPFEAVNMFDMTVTPIPLYHVKEQDNRVAENDLQNEFGFVFAEHGKKIAYLGDYYKIPPRSIDIIKDADVVFMDGTYLFEELFPDRPEQNGLKNDPDHMHAAAIIELAASFRAKKIVFTSITHLSELTHEEMQKLLPENHFLSYDGMEITV